MSIKLYFKIRIYTTLGPWAIVFQPLIQQHPLRGGQQLKAKEGKEGGGHGPWQSHSGSSAKCHKTWPVKLVSHQHPGKLSLPVSNNWPMTCVYNTLHLFSTEFYVA